MKSFVEEGKDGWGKINVRQKTIWHNEAWQSSGVSYQTLITPVYHEFTLERKASDDEIPKAISDISSASIRLLTGLVVRLD